MFPCPQGDSLGTKLTPNSSGIGRCWVSYWSGADVYVKNRSAYNGLMLAVKNRFWKTAKILIEAGIPPEDMSLEDDFPEQEYSSRFRKR